MSHRPYPHVYRALAQVERGRLPKPPLCPICKHPVCHHASEAGRPVCTRGPGLIACRDCAELRARTPDAAALVDFGRALFYGTTRRYLLVEEPRRTGEPVLVHAVIGPAMKAGGVFHVATRRGMRCDGGVEHACTLPPLRANSPLVLARAERTCEALPSQWNAWTVDGQYLYLRYRSGIGTVDAYDTEDSEQWTQPPDGRVAMFDTGSYFDGEMDLPEFCERAGLQLAADAEVIGE
ncbi:hypothetical protein ACF06P_35555 [Streptomyces sp. NPDC015684]|uniref:hypothetical protein n=1 Tax=Streptomyces sp. NPDC015684 TaxID=3364963 RepID=UPI0036FAFFD1